MVLINKKNFLIFLYFIAGLGICEAKEAVLPSKLVMPYFQGVDIQTGAVEDSINECIYEFYSEGDNTSAQETLFLEPGDFRIGKVRKISFKLGLNRIASNYLNFQKNFTEILSASGRKILYYYSDFNNLDCIEFYCLDESGEYFLYRKECFFWSYQRSTPYLTSHFIENGEGRILLYRCFFYNENSQMIEEILAGNLSGNCSIPCIVEKDGSLQMNGVECYRTKYFYSTEDPAILVKQEEENHLIATYEYDPLMKECIKVIRQISIEGVIYEEKFDQEQNHFPSNSFNPKIEDWLENDGSHCFEEQTLKRSIWQSFIEKCYSCFRSPHLSNFQSNISWESGLKINFPTKLVFEKITQTLFGKLTCFLMGSNFEAIELDCYGEREVNEKVRVTFIGGILNTREMINESLKFISETHGNVNVHYVFRSTGGWTLDLSRAMMTKMGFDFGFCWTHVYLLAAMWRDLIQEMGGVNGGGTIIHYAHSLGGTDTDRARALLSPDEQKMIRVETFGSSTWIRDQGFQSVVNHVSVNDGVSSCLIEPFGYIRNYFDLDTNVQFYGSFKVTDWPLDHILEGSTYRSILATLGKEFIETYHVPLDNVKQLTHENNNDMLEKTHIGCFEGVERNQKVRITFINGIQNDLEILYDSLKFISDSHGAIKIHYVFRPAEGVIWDLLNAFRIKTTFNLGFRSYHAYLLAKMWRRLIHDMGGIDQGGIIIHYAHSLGGTDTDRARELLSAEEQKMIRVITLGSATMIQNKGFQSVLNFVNVNDLVSYTLFVDPHGHMRNYLDPNSNIRFFGKRFYSHFFSWAGHSLLGPGYQEIVHELGKDFINEFIDKEPIPKNIGLKLPKSAMFASK